MPNFSAATGATASRSALGEAVSRALTVRVLSALVLGPPVLLLLWLGPPWTDFLLFGAAGIMVWEWARMCGARSIGWLEAVSILAVTTAVTVGALQGILTAFAVVALGASAAAATAALRRTRDVEDGGCGWFGLGVVYVAVPLLAFQWLRGLENGQSLIVWLVLVVWATDIGAFAVGRTLRGPKLWPAVSPSKTWAGAFGGLLAAGSVGLALFELLETRSFTIAILVATATSIAAQMGDFFESFVKRRFHRKDSSGLIPGHGGLLDRVDGLIGGTLAMASVIALKEVLL